jgi:Ca2+:H+ antiporter
LGFWTSIGWLTILTIFISILSEYLVDAIEVCVSAFQQIT